MMHKLRQNTKSILWVVVIAFVVTIFAVWGLDLRTGRQGLDPDVVGKVDGQPITRAHYQFVYEQLAQQVRASSQNQPLTYAQERFIHSQTWDNIIYSILTDREIARLGIAVTDDEIVGFLRSQPPAEVRQYFLDEQGNFDNESYQAALSNPEIDWTNLEQIARERVPRIKLNEYLGAQVHVSEDEVRRAYAVETVDLEIRYVEFPIDDTDLGDYRPSDADVEAYYNSHSDEFLEGEKSRVEVVQIRLQPSAGDIEDAEETAHWVREQIAAGQDFGELAKTFSASPTASVGGTTGFITKTQREPPYFDTLDGMRAGDVGGPVAASSGFYVLRLIEKKTGDSGEIQYNVQEILVEPALSRQTTDSLYTVAGELRERALAVGLRTAASEKGLALLTPAPFLRNGPIGTLGFVSSLNDFAFSKEVGSVSDLLRDEKNIYVARIVERTPESVRPLEEVRSLIEQRDLYDKKKTLTQRNATAFWQKCRLSGFDTAVETYGVTAYNPGRFRAADNVERLGSNSALAEAALELLVGDYSPPIQWRGSFYVFELLGRSQIDPADLKAKVPGIRDRILRRKAQAYAQSWLRSLRAESKIEDYRTQG